MGFKLVLIHWKWSQWWFAWHKFCSSCSFPSPPPLFPEILCSHVRNVPPISDFLVRGYSCLLSNSLQILLLCVPSHKRHKETCLHAWGECGPWTFDLRHNFSLICLLTNSRNIKKIHLVCNYICFDRYIYIALKKFYFLRKYLLEVIK